MKIGFCVLYRWRVVPGKEQQFLGAWETVTREIRDHEGGLGSRLHRASDGTWLAYAQWRNREMWENADVTTEEGRAELLAFRETIEERMEPITLEPVADYLVAARDAQHALRADVRANSNARRGLQAMWASTRHVGTPQFAKSPSSITSALAVSAVGTATIV